MGLAIWFLSGLTKESQVKVTRRALNNFSTPPDAYRRGLQQLEDAGLVSVIRKNGCAALVTLLKAPENHFDG